MQKVYIAFVQIFAGCYFCKFCESVEVCEIKIAKIHIIFQGNIHEKKVKALFHLLDGIFRTIECVSIRQFQTSPWQISGALSHCSNRAYYGATALNKHGAKAGYGAECVPQSGPLSGLPQRTDLGYFCFSIHTEELLLPM